MDRGEALTLILGGVIALESWLITHIDDRIVEAPILEYRTQLSDIGSSRVLSITVANLSRDKTYKNVEITTLFRDSLVQDAQVIPVEPFDEGRNDREIMARSASYTIPALAPHAEIAFQVSFRGNVPKIRISSVEQPMYVTPRSFETVFARYELLVLALLIGLTLLAAVPISLITLRLFEK